MISQVRHHKVTIGFHWLTFALLCVSFASVLARDLFEDKAIRSFLMSVHREIGIVVLVIVALRLLARLKFYVVAVNAELPKSVQKISALVHGILYLLLVAVPFSGWLQSSASGKIISFFGLFNIPSLMAKNKVLKEQFSEVHEALAYGLLVLVGLHILAAFWHYYIRKDRVLQAMLPTRSTANKSS